MAKRSRREESTRSRLGRVRTAPIRRRRRRTPPESPPPTPTVPPILGAMLAPTEVATHGAQMYSYGSRAMTATLTWNAAQPQENQYRWDRSDPLVNQISALGLHLGLHVLCNAIWAVEPAPGGDLRTSTPPLDMQDYHTFITQMATRYAGKVQHYSIENEGASPKNWGGTVSEYVELISTAYAAIKAVDPDAVVSNDGVSSSALGFLYAVDLYNQNQGQAAVDFINNFYENFSPGRQAGQEIHLNNVAELEMLMATDEVQDILNWMPMLVANQQYYDAFQMHYYGPPDQLPVICDWIRDQGITKPFEFWELGYGWADLETLDLQEQADGITDLITNAAAEDTSMIVIWRWTDQAELGGTGVTGLVTAQGPRPAAEAFQAMAESLS